MGVVRSECKIGSICMRFRPHILMISVQIFYSALYFLAESSFKHGMNPHVFVTYRHIVGGFVMLPFAYFLERNVRPKLTVALVAEIFVLSLLGVGLTLNMCFASLRYTSPAFITPMINSIASLTFVIAVVVKLEVLDFHNPRVIAKVLGTLISLGGVMVMTFYKGPIIRNICHPLLLIQRDAISSENWLKGSILTVASCISWALWYTMEVFTLKRYPAKLSLVTWMNFVGAAQSAVFTAFVQPKPSAWAIGVNIDLWCTLYAGVICSGLTVFFQLWCVKEKGPVFVAMFNPLCTVLVAIIAYFIVAEKLYLGGVIGAVIVIVGMYLFLWGKEQQKAETHLADLKSKAFEQDMSTASHEKKVMMLNP